MTNKNLIDDYLGHIKEYKASDTHKTYVFFLSKFQEWLKEKGRKVEDCSPEDILQFVNSNAGWSNYTKRFILGIIKKLFSYFEEDVEDLQTSKKFRKIVKMEIPTALKQLDFPKEKKMTLTKEEIKKVLKRVSGVDYAMIWLLLYLGVRRSELLAFDNPKKTKIDYRHNKITIKNAKNIEWRTLYYNDGTKKLMQEFLAVKKQKVIPPYYINNLLLSLSKKVKIPLHPHMFRHTFSNHMREIVKFDDIFIKRLMGHKTDITGRYTTFTEEQLRDVMEKRHYMVNL